MWYAEKRHVCLDLGFGRSVVFLQRPGLCLSCSITSERMVLAISLQKLYVWIFLPLVCLRNVAVTLCETMPCSAVVQCFLVSCLGCNCVPVSDVYCPSVCSSERCMILGFSPDMRAVRFCVLIWFPLTNCIDSDHFIISRYFSV
ncbi:hypothetical protein KC19_11G073400 [Ceratodon purpureus]|uniref:Uncharacterized protein n=1 Tax=Ceratodon purpureus TaxID=3225 RepID=A0A8T0GBG1_CERPU|nr:hypothetical protein KC19_11G073400 [Ceratodon purpureus]